MSRPVAPQTLITDEPKYCLTINNEWAGIITGLLLVATSDEFWGGDSEDKINGVQGIETLIEMMGEYC